VANSSPQKQTGRKGFNPEWANLPKRRCDNCGTLYKQVRPRREGEHGFCEDNCRKSFHKHQGAYSKLKGDMQKMLAKELDAIHRHLREIVREELDRRAAA
jgi:hypothetical protein